MDGLFYAFEPAGNGMIHLLRFYNASEYVIAKTIYASSIGDVNKELKTFAVDGHKLIGEPESVFMGAFSEVSDRLSFKIENEIRDPSNTWATYDLLTFKGTITDADTLQLTVTSRHRKTTSERTYRRVTGNEVVPAAS